MSQSTFIDGLWNGRPVGEWIPEIVDDVVEGLDPARVVAFGSVARGEARTGSDVDLPEVSGGFAAKVISSTKERSGADLQAAYPRALGAPGRAVPASG